MLILNSNLARKTAIERPHTCRIAHLAFHAKLTSTISKAGTLILLTDPSDSMRFKGQIPRIHKVFLVQTSERQRLLSNCSLCRLSTSYISVMSITETS